MMNKISVLVLAIFALISCDNEQEVLRNDFKGHYKIVKMTADRAFDLNNDGVQSSDLYAEISAPMYTGNPDDKPIPFYIFDQWISYAEIRPAFEDQIDYQLALFNLPIQLLDIDKDSGLRFFSYSQDMASYVYSFTSNGDITLTQGNPGTNELIQVEGIDRIDKDTFILTAQAKYYDFKDKQWFETQMQVTYHRLVR